MSKTLKIEIADFWTDEESIAGALDSAVRRHISNEHKKEIQKAVSKHVQDVCKAEFDELIRNTVRSVLDEGVTVSDRFAQPDEKRTMRELVVETVKTVVDGFDQKTGTFNQNKKHVAGLIETVIKKECEEVLAKETREAIKGINQDVLKRAKETVAEAVSKQMFSNMPRIG